MKRVFTLLVIGSSFGLVPPTTAAPQVTSPSAAEVTPTPPPLAPAKRSAAELEKLAMPIALHPDQLVAVILPASVYPVEIVQAARFVRDTNNIPKVDDQPWDDNVKAVARFPDLIKMMDADLGWTVELGQAFLDQSKELMDAIQSLRAKAQKAGTLRTTPQQIVTVTNVLVVQTNFTQIVTVTNEIVQVQPANPQVVYVPTYPPTVYYPPPAYVYNPMVPLVSFGVGMAWGAILANNCNWGHGDVDINVNNSRSANVNTSRNVNNSRTSGGAANTRPANTQKWQPDQNRMRNNSGASASTREARGWGSGNSPSTRPSTGNVGARPSTGNVGARPSTGNVGSRPSTGNAGARPSTGNVGARPSTGNAGARPSAGTSQARSSNRSGSGSAFGGASSGSSARSYSNRGSSSRGGGGFGGGGRGGGGGGRGGRR